MIPENIIKEVKSRADIVAVVQRYVALKKMGTSYKACCPFHQEKTPSFHVNPSHNSFYCFGCHKGGNVITFMMEMEKKNFPETVEALAEDLGLRWDKQTNTNPQQQAIQQTEKLQIQKMLSVSRTAFKIFFQNLRATNFEQQEALNYLRKRGLGPQIIDQFGIGLAKNSWDDLKTHLIKHNIPLSIAHDLGLLSLAPREEINSNEKTNSHAKSKEPHYYDKFRNRIIFPIQNEKNEVIGFGGRILDNTEPKYLNSATSLIFEKSQTLYNFNRAKQKIREQNQVLLVEGYMDCISLVQFGFENVVAPLGTALTEKHIQKLKSFTENLVLVFDGDNAGIKAAYHALDLCLPHSIFPKMILIPDKLDPDDYLRVKGKEAFMQLLREAPDCLEKYFVEGLKTQYQDHQSRQQFLGEATTKLSRIRDKVALTLRLKFLADLCNIDAKVLKEIVDDKKKLGVSNLQQGLPKNTNLNALMPATPAQQQTKQPKVLIAKTNPFQQKTLSKTPQTTRGTSNDVLKNIMLSWIAHLLLNPQLWSELPPLWFKKISEDEKQLASVKLLLWWQDKVRALQMKQNLEIISNPFASISTDPLDEAGTTSPPKFAPPLMKWVLDSFEKISDPEIRELVSSYSIRDPFNRSSDDIEKGWKLALKKWQVYVLKRQKERKMMELKLIENQLSIVPIDKEAQIQSMLQELDLMGKQIDLLNKSQGQPGHSVLSF